MELCGMEQDQDMESDVMEYNMVEWSGKEETERDWNILKLYGM